MSDKMREEFEEVFKSKMRAGGYAETGFTIALWRDAEGRYESATTIAAWWGWQASRAAQVVELPPTPNRGIGYGLWDAGKESCREAIEAAGVKVKS